MVNPDDACEPTLPTASVAWAAHQNEPVIPGSNEYDHDSNNPDPDTEAGTRTTPAPQPVPFHHNPVALSWIATVTDATPTLSDAIPDNDTGAVTDAPGVGVSIT